MAPFVFPTAPPGQEIVQIQTERAEAALERRITRQHQVRMSVDCTIPEILWYVVRGLDTMYYYVQFVPPLQK